MTTTVPILATDVALPAELDAALARVADVLATLPPATWEALGREERFNFICAMQYYEFAGLPEVMLPERILGERILELFAAKYPALAQDAVGTA